MRLRLRFVTPAVAIIAATCLVALDASQATTQQQTPPPTGQAQTGTAPPTVQTPPTAAPRRTEARPRARSSPSSGTSCLAPASCPSKRRARS